MSRPAPKSEPTEVMAYDPLVEADEILGEEFYGSTSRRRRRQAAAAPKPTHYKIVCISLYTEDIDRLEALVTELKKLGHSKANKSAIIRYALAQVDVTKVPKGL